LGLRRALPAMLGRLGVGDACGRKAYYDYRQKHFLHGSRTAVVAYNKQRSAGLFMPPAFA
jgi:hypothetical protein